MVPFIILALLFQVLKHFRLYLDTSNLMDVFEAMLPIPK